MLVGEKFCFIHNPKCAGTAIHTALLPYATSVFWHQGFDPVDRVVVDLAHLDSRERPHFRVFPERFKFSFMVVRDPIERFLSAFSEHCRQHERDMDVNTFVDLEATAGNFNFDWKYVHFRSQRLFHSHRVYVFRHSDLKEEWPRISMKCLGKVVPLTVTRKDVKVLSVKDLAERSVRKLTLLYFQDYLWLNEVLMKSGKEGYELRAPVESDGSHEQNMMFIHDDTLRPHLDVSKLRPGEMKAFSQKGAQ